MIIVKTEEFVAMKNELEALRKKVEEYDAIMRDIVKILDNCKDEEDIDWNPIVPDIQVG